MRKMVGIASVVLALASLAGTAAAEPPRGSIRVNGNGAAATEPEFAKLTVKVTSLCYDTARGAKDANAVLANKLIQVLLDQAIGIEAITTAPGATALRTESLWIDGTEHVLCQRKWRSENQIRLQLDDIGRLADVQDALLVAIDADGYLDPEKSTQTYAELAEPTFGITEATRLELRRQAQIGAYADARAQFDAFASQCPFQDVRLATIAPPTYEVTQRVQIGADMQEMPAGVPTPVIPEEIRVSATFQFEWSFVAPAGCPL